MSSTKVKNAASAPQIQASSSSSSRRRRTRILGVGAIGGAGDHGRGVVVENARQEPPRPPPGHHRPRPPRGGRRQEGRVVRGPVDKDAARQHEEEDEHDVDESLKTKQLLSSSSPTTRTVVDRSAGSEAKTTTTTTKEPTTISQATTAAFVVAPLMKTAPALRSGTTTTTTTTTTTAATTTSTANNTLSSLRQQQQPFPLPAMGRHVLLVTGRRRPHQASGGPEAAQQQQKQDRYGGGDVVESIASQLVMLHSSRGEGEEDAVAVAVYEVVAGNRRSDNSRGGRTKRAKLSNDAIGGIDRADPLEEEQIDDDDDTIIRRLEAAAGRSSTRPTLTGAPPTMTRTRTTRRMPVIVHVVETLEEWESNRNLRVEMDHVVFIDWDLDVVRGNGGGARVNAQRLSDEDCHVLRRNIMGSWWNRVSRVRVLDRPFGRPTSTTQPRIRSNASAASAHRNADRDDDDDHKNAEHGIPTFVCHQYDPNSIQQVARVLLCRVTVGSST